MAEVIRMPRMSDTMTEGVIVEWHKKVGDKVEPGDILAEVETDKATMELESYQDGVLLHIGIEKGNAVPVEAIIAVLGEEGEEFASLLTEPAVETAIENKAEVIKENNNNGTPLSETGSTQVIETPSPSNDKRIKASPLAKKLAADRGIELSMVNGTGGEGRIIKRDIENYQVGDQAAPVQIPQIIGQESYTDTKLSQMRKAVASRLTASKFNAPHFYLTMEINMDQVITARKSMNEVSPVKISFNDIIIKAVASALRQHPAINVSWLGDRIRQNHHIHIGMAVAIEDGLIVPVIKFADNKSLSVISAESKQLGQKARDRKLKPVEFEGNTFTVSNLGMFDIDEFTAIINPPDACIMAIGSIKETAVFKDGIPVPSNIMKVTLSCDHRAVDGASGAKFLQTFKSLMEDPVRLLI